VNWYRTREANYQDELSIRNREINVPLLFIQATRDAALPPHLGKGMGRFVPQLTIEQVDTSHWALWEKPQEVNEILARWLRTAIPDAGNESRL
jgi:pimeloyl-ACP methyl ester carboxylesterase